MKIAIVDDDAAVREAIAVVLEAPTREVMAYADGASFLAASGSADIVFLDLRMPGLSGFEVLRALGQRGGHPPVVMISAHGDVKAAVEAMRLGAAGFIEKPFTPDDLETAIQEATGTVPPPAPQRELLDRLTAREREVALLLFEGLSNKEVALRLACSPRTVEIHRARIFEKIGVKNVAGLVRRLSVG